MVLKDTVEESSTRLLVGKSFLRGQNCCSPVRIAVNRLLYIDEGPASLWVFGYRHTIRGGP